MNRNTSDISEEMYGKWKNALELAFSGKSKKERLLYPALAAFFISLGFLFCARPLPLSNAGIGIPLSDALLCAAGAYTPFVYIGNLLGSIHFGFMSLERILGITLIFVLRIITGSKHSPENGFFSESIITKTAVCAVFCLCESGMFAALNGVSRKSAMTILTTLTVTPLLTLIFATYYSKSGESRFRRATHEISMLFIFSVAVYCAKGITFAFFAVDTLLAVFFILCVAKFGGFARGAIFGFTLGYIASPQYFACYLILGGLGALLFNFSTFSACGVAVAAASVAAVTLSGASALLTFVPEAVIACTITSPVIRYCFFPKGFPYPRSDAAYTESFSENMRYALGELSFLQSVRSASDSLRAITGYVEDANSAFKDTERVDDSLINSVYSGFCESCPMSPICHDTEKSKTRLALSDLILLHTHRASEQTENIPPYLSSHCIRLRELNEYVKNLAKTSPVTHQSKPATPLISYASAADIISVITHRAEQELVFDSDAERSVAKLLYSIGLPFGGVSVLGKTRKKICLYGVDKRKLKKLLPELKKGLKTVFGCDHREIINGTEGAETVILLPYEELCAEVGISLSCKSGESISGDTAMSFNDDRGNFYALITDGMGSGEQASRSSAITAEMIRGFMLSGIEEKLALRLASESLPAVCDECFSTVDLMKLDLISGDATVTKSHAAASYILRGGSVYLCDAHSMPVGTGADATPERISLKLEAGDTVVMVSDGIASSPADAVKIPDILGLSSDLDAKELADKILSKAIELNGKSDDMSALVVKITAA